MESMQGKRRYTVCDDFFEVWSDRSAYLLGLLTADGSADGRSISIDLAEKDIELVEFVRDCLCPTKPLEYRIKTKSVRIRVSSVVLCRKLESLGIFKNKTGKEFLPDIPYEFIAPYIRGVFDGDGWVYTRRNSVECGIVSASKDFLISLRGYFKDIGVIRLKKKTPNSRDLWQWDMYSRHAEMFRDIIYNDASIFLSRKRDKFYSNYKLPNKQRWAEWQVLCLIKNYVVGGNLRMLSEKIGKSYKAVSKKIWKLGLSNA